MGATVLLFEAVAPRFVVRVLVLSKPWHFPLCSWAAGILRDAARRGHKPSLSSLVVALKGRLAADVKNLEKFRAKWKVGVLGSNWKAMSTSYHERSAQQMLSELQHFHRRTQERCNCVGGVQAKACANRQCATALHVWIGLRYLFVSHSARKNNTVVNLLWIYEAYYGFMMVISCSPNTCFDMRPSSGTDRDAGCKTTTDRRLVTVEVLLVICQDLLSMSESCHRSLNKFTNLVSCQLGFALLMYRAENSCSRVVAQSGWEIWEKLLSF
eukprot:s2585_g3.t1